MAEVGLFTLYLFSRTSFIHSIYSQYLNVPCLGRENFSQATTTCHPKNESWYIFTKVIQESRFRYRLGHMRNLTLLNTKVYTLGQKRRKYDDLYSFLNCLYVMLRRNTRFTQWGIVYNNTWEIKDEEIVFYRPLLPHAYVLIKIYTMFFVIYVKITFP